ncbi:glycoside hydrolase/deacetylase [Serendipita vermifera]|nr:glycoside hydrolase/deacetylase [Serendipita vermifera]
MSAIAFGVTLLLALTAPAHSTSISRRDASVYSTCKHDFAYTWDDGPYTWQEEIVDEFNCIGGKTTFFVNGNHDGCIYSEDNVQRLRYAFEAGHQIGIQSWSRADLSQLSEADIDTEIQRLDVALIKILGVRPKFLRPTTSLPDSVASYIQNKWGKTLVGYDKYTDDYSGDVSENIHQFYQGLAAEGSGHPHIAMSHQTQAPALDALDLGSAEALIDAGIKLVTASQCLDLPAYETVGGYGVRDSTWTCDSWTAPSTNPTCAQRYTVKDGDKTCSNIGSKFGLSGADIYLANPSLNCDDVWTWTSVCIPPAPTSPPKVDCVQTYNAAQGDTCQSIATKFGTTAEKVHAANTFVTCNDIWSGTPICVPASTGTITCASTYYSKSGDTCDSIGSKNGLTGTAIKNANTFLTCTDIWAGTPICIPTGGNTGTTDPTTPTTPTCASTYYSKAGDTCDSIGSKNGLTGTAIKNANTFLTCTDIWAGTPICIPTGGSNTVTCVSQYTAGDNETCTTVGTKFGLDATAVYNANKFVGCNDIWKGTNLCIPPGGRDCTNTIRSWPGATCNDIAGAYGTTAENIKFWNSWVNCNDIWTDTYICVSH